MEDILIKLRSVELCMSAHPHNEEHSEFADRIDDLQEIQKEVKQLVEWKESAMKVMNDINLQEVGKLMGLKLGEDVAKNILPFIKNLTKQLNQTK